MSLEFRLVCHDCGAEYDPGGIRYLCPECASSNHPGRPPAGVLQAAWDYSRVADATDMTELLPIESAGSLPPLRIGSTPLYRAPRLGEHALDHELYLKDDSVNPTYSFKDRASGVVSARARELGLSTVIAASTGNAGSSIAGVCASQNQRAIVLVPSSAPQAKLIQIRMYGAVLVPVQGTYDQAFDLSVAISARTGWYNRNTAYNPLTVEGKKTVSYEIHQQLAGVPDLVFVPVGDGVILAGVFRGFEDLRGLGRTHRMPTIVAVQAAGSDNLVRNLGGEFEARPSSTLADSIAVDVPRNFRMAQRFMQTYNGESVTVSDQEIRAASRRLSASTGLFAEPAAAASVAGYFSYARHHPLRDARVVCLLTGSGLKDPLFAGREDPTPHAIPPTTSDVLAFLGERGVQT